MTLAPRPRKIGFFRSIARFFRELGEALVQAFTSLVAHKLRAALTISGVSIGVAAVIAIYSAAAGLDQQFSAALSNLGPNTIYVSKWQWGVNVGNFWKFRNRPMVGKSDYKALLAGMTLAEAIAPIAGAGNTATIGAAGGELKDINVRGTTEAYPESGGWQVKRGRFLSSMDDELGTDACVIGADLEDAFFKSGDALGSTLKVGAVARCTVVGTLLHKGTAFGQSQDSLLLMPLSAFGRAFGGKRAMTVAVVAPPDKLRETEEEIVAVLRQSRRLGPDQEDNFSVNRQDKLQQGFQDTTRSMKLVAGLVGLITLIVGGIGVMNILLVSVKERTREIGVRRALGARKTTILMQFLAEAVGVSFAGGVLGTSLGIGTAWFIAQVTPMSAAVSPEVVLLGAGFSVATGLLFGIWPAWSAASLHPIEALRHE